MSVKTLRTDLDNWIGDNRLRGDAKFYTREEWNDRGEQYGVKASLTLVIDGSPLYSILNCGTSRPLYQEFEELVARHGFYFELGFAWSVHFYPTRNQP